MARETILIVEDEGIIAAYLQDMLRGLGYTALEPVATGEAAIAAVKAQPPDLVLMDIKLAGKMDGITAAGHIQSAADIPIVYLTGYSQDLQLQQARVTTPYGYLVKPATERELAATIEIALYKHALDRRLKESEEKYRRLVDNANEAIVVAQDGRLKFVNRMASDLTGYSEQELISTPFPEFIHPDDRGMVVERHLRRLQGDVVQPRYAFRIMTRDGSVKWAEIGAVLIDWEGKPATLNFLSDITERKRAEEAVRESEQRFRMVLESSVDNLYRRNLETDTYDYMSPAVERILGYSPEEILSMPLKSVVSMMHPDDIDRVKRVIAESMASDRDSYLLEYRFRHKDGQYRWLSDLFTVIRDAQGRPLYFVGNARDITERKRAEEALQAANQTIQAVIQSSPLPILALDLKGNLTMWNPAAERIFGWGAQEVLGCQNPAVPREKKEESDAMFVRVLQGNGFTGIETQRRRKDDSLIDVSISTAPLRDGKGNIRGIMAMLADITERKQAEEEIQRHVRHLATLHEIDRALTSTLDLDQVLSTLLEQVQRATDAEAASVALVEAGTGALVFRQAVGGAGQDVIGLRLEPGQGIAGWVALHKQSVLAPDVAADPRFYGEVDHRTGFTTRDLVCVPLMIRNTVTGVIELVNKRQGKYSEDEVKLLESVAAQAAVALENARLFEAERAGRQRLETLYRIGQAINSTLDAGAILDRLTDEAMRATHATHGSALVAHPDLGCFERRSLRGYSPEQTEKARSVPLPLNRGVNSRAYQAQRIAYLSDVRTDPDYFSLIPETRSELAVPILRGNQVLGNLDLQSPEADAFHDVDLSFLQALTDQVAIALENARLFEAERRRLEELSIISDVALAGATGQPFDETVARATQNLSRLWPEAPCGFLFLDEADQSLHVHPSYHGLQPESITSVRIPLSQGLTGWAAHERQPVRVGDVTADPRYICVVDNVRSEMAAPLIADDHVIGIVNVDSHRLNAFSQDDLLLLTTLAGQLATLFEKARLDTALEEERASLAQRVEERTAELNIVNAELLKAAHAKDEFLAGMSHELRTPLNAILGMSESLQEQALGPLNEKQLKSLRTIEESGRHLLALINDILDLSKVEAGKVELQVSPVAVEPLCQASLQFVKQLAFKKHIQVSATFDRKDLTLQADERRLKQILVNLLNNAVKFTSEGGEVGLEVVSDVERQRIHFTVWDTGIGISQANIGRLFQPFVQLDSSLSRRYTGTGLGLSLVKRLAELHGGNVSVESKVGKGSRFTVSLPWKETSRQVESRQGIDTGPLVSLSTPSLSTTVLIAEDNEASLDVTSEYLSAKGYHILVARDGSEVIRQTREEKPDVILMDIQMPGMDGLEAIRRIRADAEQSVARIPIVALTALAMPGDREWCMEAGANEYLSKPVSLKKLAEVIEAQLRET